MKKMKLFLALMFFIHTNLIGAGKWEKVYETGEQWGFSIKSIKCKDSEDCIAIGNKNSYPIFLMSNNGGFTWNEAYSDKKWSYYDSLGRYWFYKPSQCAEVSYLPSGKIVAVGDTGTVWKSNDNGKTWDTFKLNARTNPVFIADRYNISMYSDDFGAISCPFELYITKDGWKSYQKVQLNIADSIKPISLDDIYCPANGVIKILVYKGGVGYYVINSEDYGLNWSVYKPIYPMAYKFFFLDQNNGYAVAGQRVKDYIYKDLIFHTTDGGKTWETQLDTIEHYPDGLTRIHFYDYNHGVAIGNWHKMWRTSNGGKNWYKDSTFNNTISTDYFYDIVMLSPNEMLGALADKGEIYRYSEETSVEEDGLNTNFDNISISPNPAREYIEITGFNKGASSLVKGNEIRIYDVLGECVLSVEQTPSSVQRIDVSGLAAGVYFVRIGEWTGRFVKI